MRQNVHEIGYSVVPQLTVLITRCNLDCEHVHNYLIPKHIQLTTSVANTTQNIITSYFVCRVQCVYGANGIRIRYKNTMGKIRWYGAVHYYDLMVMWRNRVLDIWSCHVSIFHTEKYVKCEPNFSTWSERITYNIDTSSLT